MSKVRFLGLDVHAHTISAAIAEPNGEVRSLGVIRNTPAEIQKLLKRLEPVARLRVCYEAGPDGLCIVLAAHTDEGALRSDRTVAGAG